MRRLLIVGALLALPLLAPVFVPGPTLGADGVAVGAAGLLLLASFAVAEIAAAAGFSRIVGALVAGAVLGPMALADAGPHVVPDLQWFRDLAAGVLALLAGASTSLRGLGRRGRIAALQVVSVVVSCGVLVASASGFGLPALVDAPLGTLALVAVVAGLVLSLGAPLVGAVMGGELRAVGPVADAANAIGGARTLFAVVALAVALPLAADGAAGDHPAVLVGVAVTGAAAVGAAALAVVWLRTGAPELMVMLVGALGVTVTVRSGGGDPVVALLLAGLLVRALSDRGEHLAHLAEQASYPALLLLFGLIGASIDTESIPRLGPLALAVLSVRSLALIAASVGGARLAGVTLSGRCLGGMQLATGVLTLEAAAVVSRLGTDWAKDVGGLLALVAVAGLATGPLLARAASDRAGETERIRRRRKRAVDEDEAAPPDVVTRPRAAIPQPELLHPELDRTLSELRNRLFDVHEHFVTDFLDERLYEARGLVGTLRDLAAARLAQLEVEAPETPDAAKRDELVRRAAEEIARDWRDAVAYHAASLQERGPDARALLALVRAVEELVLSAPPVRIPLRDAQFDRHRDDGMLVRMRKLRARLRVRVGGRISPKFLLREVPLARIGRVCLSGPLPRALERVVVPLVGHRATRLWHLLIEAQDELAGRLREAEGTERVVEAVRRAAQVVDGELANLVEDLEGYRSEISDRLLLALGDGFAALLTAAAEAGTPLLPRKLTDPSRVFEDNRRARAAIEEQLERWWIAARGASGSLMLRLDVAAMRRGALTRTTEAAARLRGVVGRTLLRQPKRLLTECATWRERLDVDLMEGAPRDAMVAALDRARDAIVAAADTTELERIRDEGGLHGLLAEVHRNLRLLCDKLPPSVDVAPPGSGGEDPEHPPTGLALQPYPLREVAVTLFGQHAAARLASVEPSIERGVESTFMTLVDGANTVRFHVDAAIAELAQGTEDDVSPDVLRTARDFALGGIGRAAENIEAFVEAVGAELDVHVADIERVLVDAMDRAAALVRRCDPRESTSLLGGTQEPGDLEEERGGRLRSLSAELRARLRPSPRGLARRLGERMGLSVPTADVGREADELLAGDRADIPETYRRLFLPAPVGMETLFVPRTREMATLESAVARWRRGETTAVLVAAPVGIGRRSLLERALRGLLSEYPTQRRRIGARVTSERDAVRELSRLVGSQRDLTAEELRAKLTGAAGRAVRVVEDAHRLYLPHPAALGGMERFLRALTESGPQVLWIVTVEAHARAQLDLLMRFSDVFTHLIELPGFDRGETERLIRARHQVSGAKLHFLPPSGRRGARRTQEQLARATFDALHRDSGGHPTLALFLWLRQLQRWDEQEGLLEIAPPAGVRFEFLDRLDWERLLDLKRLLLFGAMTPAGFAMAHRLPTGDAEMRLRALERASLVRAERVGHEVRFALNPVLVHPLTRLLEERNLL